MVRLAAALQEFRQRVEKELSEVVVVGVKGEVALATVDDEAVLVALGVVAFVGVNIEVDPLLNGELADTLNTEDVLIHSGNLVLTLAMMICFGFFPLSLE